MKKVSLVLGFALMAGMVFAQNSATTNQSGVSNKSTITQDGNQSNTAKIDQIGSSNSIMVEQKNGSGNTAIGVQNGDKNGEASVAAGYGYIKQDGASNKAYLFEGTLAKTNPTVVATSSSQADGFIDQKGNGNEASLTTKGSGFNTPDHGIKQIQLNGTLGNYATVTQENYNVDMNVFQSGSNNHATGHQFGTENQYDINQNGLSNEATVIQNGNNNENPVWNYGVTPLGNILNQDGTLNKASVTQGNSDVFLITQNGVSNTAYIAQADNSIVNVNQQGNNNTVGGLLSTGAKTDVASFGNGAGLQATQNGDYNDLYVSTAGSLTTVQGVGGLSHNNTIEYTQTQAGIVGLTQAGSHNLILLKNTSSVAVMDVDVDQSGDSNGVALYANGFGAAATGTALFAGVKLDVDQTGIGSNLLNLNSTDADATVIVMQSGSSNMASVVQN
jgi:hypothetical protein